MTRSLSLLALALAGCSSLPATRSSNEAFSTTSCFSNGGNCDAEDNCIKYEYDADHQLLPVMIGVCDEGGIGPIGGSDGTPNGPPPPWASFTISDAAYIPASIPAAGTAATGMPCKGSAAWNRLSTAWPGDPALTQNMPVWQEPWQLINHYYFAGDDRSLSLDQSRSSRVRNVVTYSSGQAPTQPAAISTFVTKIGPSREYDGNTPNCLYDIKQATAFTNQQSYKTVDPDSGAIEKTFTTTAAAAYPFTTAAPSVSITEVATVATDAFNRVHVSLRLQHALFPNHDTVLKLPNGNVYGLYHYETQYAGPGVYDLDVDAPNKTVEFDITPLGSVVFNGRIVSPGTWLD